eukprot:COSAG04_NODE_2664_length_3765_cov_3.404801_2_plen_210_part_00
MPRLTSPVFDRATARPFVLTFEDAVLGVEQADDDGESGSDMDSDEETHRAIITAAKQRMGGHSDSESSDSESDSDAAGSDSQRVRRDAIMITEHGSEETAGVVVSRRDKLHAQLQAQRSAQQQRRRSISVPPQSSAADTSISSVATAVASGEASAESRRARLQQRREVRSRLLPFNLLAILTGCQLMRAGASGSNPAGASTACARRERV